MTQWDFQNKRKSGWTGKSSFVLEVPLRYLRPSVIYSVPCDWILQRAYCAPCEKDLKDNKYNSLHLERKYAPILVLGHYLFLVAHSFPRGSLSENCSLLGTDNVRGQISEHIFAPNGDYCLYITG